MDTDNKSAQRTAHPLVTIAIPTHNRARWLPRSIGSALAQSHTRVEVVVSDNASTDDTERVLQECADPRVRTIRQSQNIGLIPNWNACLEEARGEYILFVSDDDFVKPDMVERCLELVETDAAVPVIVALSDVYFADESHTSEAHPNETLSTGILDGSAILKEFLEERISTPMCSVMFRAQSLRDVGGFPLNMDTGADTIVLGFLLLGAKAGFVNRSCAVVSAHAANTTSQLSLDYRLSCLHKTTQLLLDRIRCTAMKDEARIDLVRGANRFFARHVIRLTAAKRHIGGNLGDTLSTMWAARSSLQYLKLQDLTWMARPLAATILPHSITTRVRQLKRRSKPAANGPATTPL